MKICKNEFHKNYFVGFPSMFDPNKCSVCKQDFHYINRDGTINKEQYDKQYYKSIRKFQESRTEFFRRKK